MNGPVLNHWVRLVRAPAALTVLGDAAAGAAAAGRPLRGRRLLLPLSSVALYWAGMAVNDWADRELDAVERPERPIPSGRISAGAALGAGAGLTTVGIALAACGGGRDSARIALPLATAIWAYDTVLKSTPAGPAGMAACRALDVLMGAGADRAGTVRGAVTAIAGHTFAVTMLSAGEVHGGSPAAARSAFAGTALATGITLAGRARSGWHRLACAAFTGVYAATVGTAQLVAAAEPSPSAVREATATGIHGTVGLQAALTARNGSLLGAGLVASALPLARRLARRVSPT